jgi:hypothetical protein
VRPAKSSADQRFAFDLTTASFFLRFGGSVVDLFQANDDARRFGLVRRQSCEVRIAPFSKPYYFSVLSFHPWNLKQLQYVESPGIEKERMMPKQFAELRDCGMILGKHLCSKLRQGSGYLDFV